MCPRVRRRPLLRLRPARRSGSLVVLALRAPVAWRLWAPLIGIVVGCAVAAPFGLYDIQPVIAAPWIGFPDGAVAGIGPDVQCRILGAAASVCARYLSRRDLRPLATALPSNGSRGVSHGQPIFAWSKALSTPMGWATCCPGLSGRLLIRPTQPVYRSPNSPGSLRAASGVYCGVHLLRYWALSPKVTALLIAIPNPVGAAYVTLLIGLLFVQGMRLVVDSGLNHRKAAVVGLSFWLGVGFQKSGNLRRHAGWDMGHPARQRHDRLVVLRRLCWTAFMELTAPRRRRLEVELAAASMPKIDEFLRAFAAKVGWGRSGDRAAAAPPGKRTLAILDTTSGGRCGQRTALDPHRTACRRNGRAGIFGDCRGRKSRRPAGVPERTARDNRRTRDFVPAVAALRFVSAAPEIPRPRHHCGAGRAHALETRNR